MTKFIGKLKIIILRWATNHNFKIENILNDGTSSNETRLGAVGDLLLSIEKFALFGQDLMIIAGDTVFDNNFSLNKIMLTANGCKENILLFYECKDEETKKSGIVEINPDTKIVSKFLEKPDPLETKSRKASPCFYILRHRYFDLIKEFVDLFKNRPKDEWDAPGKLIAWLVNVKKVPFLAVKVTGRLDVGDLTTYIAANEYFTSQK